MCTQSFTETGRGAQSFEGTGPPTPEGNDCAQWPVRIAIYTGGRIEADGSRRTDRTVGTATRRSIQRRARYRADAAGGADRRTGTWADRRTGRLRRTGRSGRTGGRVPRRTGGRVPGRTRGWAGRGGRADGYFGGRADGEVAADGEDEEVMEFMEEATR
jgi:hypothetical protein